MRGLHDLVHQQLAPDSREQLEESLQVEKIYMENQKKNGSAEFREIQTLIKSILVLF